MWKQNFRHFVFFLPMSFGVHVDVLVIHSVTGPERCERPLSQVHSASPNPETCKIFMPRGLERTSKRYLEKF